MNELIVGGIGLLTTIVSGLVSWLFARKKYYSEVDHNVIDNMKESLEFYEKLSNDNKMRLTEALQENKKLREDVNGLLVENAHLRKDIEDLRNQILKLTTTICVDLSCQLRNRDYSTLDIVDNESKSRKNKTKNNSGGGRKPSSEE